MLAGLTNVLPPIFDTLYKAVKATMADPKPRQLMAYDDAIPLDSPSSEQLEKLVANEVMRWDGLIERAELAHFQ